ncbi:stressosome-associated protein Prli42 [Salinicoccus hispanicus]|uniref:Stressosome-associated protein Prli42 n=1 Tax=Salinicoccus hispanicus TaxID=157225 RepID=A0A6N8TYX8_9STAP|nr:stressosome-associated protein Prli42 [Salinicoccus hispanicus]MXQ50237.1 stressosome-associated protein Prli42 [Salinicoccus hispanicus]
MSNRKVQKAVIWFMIFLIVISGVLFGVSMLTTL